MNRSNCHKCQSPKLGVTLELLIDGWVLWRLNAPSALPPRESDDLNPLYQIGRAALGATCAETAVLIRASRPPGYAEASHEARCDGRGS